jgi:hypothetical protein
MVGSALLWLGPMLAFSRRSALCGRRRGEQLPQPAAPVPADEIDTERDGDVTFDAHT